MKEDDDIETNVNFFWKNSIALGDIAFRNVLLFLKIVTKWREFQKSRLIILLPNEVLKRIRDEDYGHRWSPNLRSGVFFYFFLASLAREGKKVTPDTFI